MAQMIFLLLCKVVYQVLDSTFDHPIDGVFYESSAKETRFPFPSKVPRREIQT